MIKKIVTKLSCVTACVFIAINCYAADVPGLVDIYSMAKQNDADILAAEATYNAEAQARPLARANLLPHIDLNANTSGIRQKTKGQTFGVLGRTVDFNERGYSLNVSQTLYHHNFYVQLRQAKNTVAKAQAELDLARQDLILRVSKAYFDVLAAQDNLEFELSRKTAIARQLEQATKRFEVGLIPITDVKEAQASYDLAVAREIEAENSVELARDALLVIIGQPTGDLRRLSDRMQLIHPEPNNIEAWETTATDQNLSLLASQHATEIAAQEVKLQKSKHLPTFDVVATHSDTNSGGISGSREFEEDRIGLELNFPIVQGGRTYYQTKEARYNYKAALHQHEKQRRDVIRQARDAYLKVISGISRVNALAKALESTQAAAHATEAGFKAGTRTSVDVLLALKDTFSAQRDYSRSKYDYLISTLELKKVAGALSTNDLVSIDDWLER